MVTKKALLVMDFINEIVHPEGVYAKEGYYHQVEQHNTLEHAAAALHHARNLGMPVIFVVVGFPSNYDGFPQRSRIFAPAREHRVLQLGTWSTEVHQSLSPASQEHIVIKNRVSPFFNTGLEKLLQSEGIEELILTGVSTEHVILATTLEGHDRDFDVTVLHDACASVSHARHLAALERIGRTANIQSTADFLTTKAAGHDQ
ncbi:cysteine hydrolase family protein [Pseudomonas japonica]|uniref:cysteine hydrolase family protein n=1 Tax=Pseudomonas japonica TaxID=256466 RepID=UPI0038253919